LANGTSLGCKSLAETYLDANTISEARVKARAAAGTDTVAIKLAANGQSISLLTAADLRGGGQVFARHSRMYCFTVIPPPISDL
jgi:hypothetical protein